MHLVLDIGGTKTRIGIVSETYKLLESSLILTNKDYKSGIDKLFNFIKAKNIRFSKICLGIAGMMDKGRLYSSPNLKDWVGKPIVDDFKNQFTSEFYIENDAALSGLGEAVYGAAKGYKIVSYITISTGIGGARIVNGRIDEKVYGFEPGHHKIVLKKGKSSFESLASGKAIKKKFGDKAENIFDKSTWNKIIKNVSIGVCNSIYFWSPEIIVLGGGVTSSEMFDLNLLKKEVKKKILKTYPKSPLIVKSVLGDFSGIWGGIAYLRGN